MVSSLFNSYAKAEILIDLDSSVKRLQSVLLQASLKRPRLQTFFLSYWYLSSVNHCSINYLVFYFLNVLSLHYSRKNKNRGKLWLYLYWESLKVIHWLPFWSVWGEDEREYGVLHSLCCDCLLQFIVHQRGRQRPLPVLIVPGFPAFRSAGSLSIRRCSLKFIFLFSALLVAFNNVPFNNSRGGNNGDQLIFPFCL